LLIGKPEGKRTLGRPRLDGRIILKWTLWEYDMRVWAAFILFRIGTDVGLL
jgi:hypothetical protein